MRNTASRNDDQGSHEPRKIFRTWIKVVHSYDKRLWLGSPEVVEEGIEGQPVPPAGGEVVDVHALVSLRALSAPRQQGPLKVGLSKVVHHVLHHVLDLERHKT